MGKDLKDNPEYIIEKVNFLEKLKLCELSFEEIRKSLFDSLNIPYHIFPQTTGANSRIFRGQTCGEIPYDKISRLSYNPKPSTKIGRANLINESVFYSALSLDTAAIESCQDELRKDNKKSFYITVGEWELKNDIEINIICHSKEALEVETDLNIAADSLEKKMREGRTEEEYKAALYESEFYANQFAKAIINCENDYAFSAICASQLLNSIDVKSDGICYPSVAYKYKSFNVVYKKELFDNKVFQIVNCYFVRVIFEDIDNYPFFEVLKETNRFDKDIILW